MRIIVSIFRLTLPLLAAFGLLAADGPAPGLNHFAADTYRELARGRGNLIFSPFSISTALSMALAGARGQTAREMSSVLHQLQSGSDYPAGLAALVDDLIKQGNTGGNQLVTANSLWLQRGFPILAGFRQTLETQYRAPLHEADFSGAPELAREAINQWTEQQTRGRIRDLFGPGSLDGSNRLVLTSAIYFLGQWRSAFPRNGTRPASFRTGAGAVQADFMHQSGSFGYAETPSAQVLELKYSAGPVVFDVILPKADNGIAELDAAFDAGDLDQWLGNLKIRTVDVTLPRFRAESDFSLKETLSRMGMATAFTNRADFSGIDDKRDLAISTVRHKAFVEVNEEGTEAAAATGVGVALVSMAIPEAPAVFRADHPFFFLIRDTRSRAILFAGRLLNPKAGK